MVVVFYRSYRDFRELQSLNCLVMIMRDIEIRNSQIWHMN